MKFKIMLLCLAFNFGSSMCSDYSAAARSSISSCIHPKAFGVCMICSSSKPSGSTVIADAAFNERVNSSDNDAKPKADLSASQTTAGSNVANPDAIAKGAEGTDSSDNNW